MAPPDLDPAAATGCLAQAAVAVLTTGEAAAKAAASRAAAALWRRGGLPVGQATPPDRPARPSRPELRDPHRMPRRRAGGSPRARAALLHAIAHIELNAVDLAWDIIARFAALEVGQATPGQRVTLPRAFFDDWVAVADDEARHFAMVADRLAAFDTRYGDLPAHDGLWRASQATAHDIGARLAIVPMVFEARGLDVTPAMIQAMRSAGDADSAAILQVIHDDEVGHVRAGVVWFDHVCAQRGVEPIGTWHGLVRSFYGQALKRPFDHAARARAGLPPEWYEPLADEG